MFCSQCGKQIEDYSLFCRFCGAKINVLQENAPTDENHNSSGFAGDLGRKIAEERIIQDEASDNEAAELGLGEASNNEAAELGLGEASNNEAAEPGLDEASNNEAAEPGLGEASNNESVNIPDAANIIHDEGATEILLDNTFNGAISEAALESNVSNLGEVPNEHNNEYIDHNTVKPADFVAVDEGTKRSKSNRTKILIASIILVILLIAVLAEVVLLLFSGGGSPKEKEKGGGILDGVFGGGKSSKYTFTVNILSAENESEIKNATISVFEGFDNTEGEPVFISSFDDEDENEDESGLTGYKAKGLIDGDYTMSIEADGYVPYIANVSVVNEGLESVYLTPMPIEGTYVFRVDWQGEHDLDLCVFDSEQNDYFSIGNPSDDLGGLVCADNGSDKGFELIYIPESMSDIVRTIYVVDTDAAKNDSVSSMENDGVTISAYDSKGEVLKTSADSTKNSPIWNAAYVYNGAIYNDSSEYLADCMTKNSWARYLKEGQLQRLIDKILDLNTSNSAIPSFNPSEDNYSPGVRSELKAWDKTVFYAMEEHLSSGEYYDKNFCPLKKVEAINSLTGNLVDYDVYLNPVTMLPNKIVSIEYLSYGIEVYEYYFDNNGKVSFIFKYTTDNYVSTYATVDKVGERYLFNDDSLTTWRIVRGGRDVDNFCYGQAEVDRLNEGSWAKSSIKEYSTIGSDNQARYDETERRMINYAYNTYNMVLDAEGIGRIVGVVYAGDYTAYENAEIEIYDKKFETLLYTVRPNSYGEYSIYVPLDDYEYNLKVKGDDGATECEIYDVDVNDGTLAVYVDSVFIFPGNESDQCVYLYIGNAFYGHGASVCDANIYVRKGINNKTGDIYLSTVTNYDGYVELYLPPGVYTIEASKEGYESIYYTIVSNPWEYNWYEYYTPPTLGEGEYAIVLSWGEYPYDLDSHLFTNTENGSAHVWYADKYDPLNSYLDVDDTSSYGPETVTIRTFNSNYYYKYCVIDYTNSCQGYYNSYDMSYSNATVNVYSSGGHIATYHVPVNRSGVIWEVFEIRNGVLTPIQRYYDDMENYGWWNH